MATATPTAPDTATNGATKKKEDASLPRPVFTNAEAGALEFPSSNSRIYNYYTPRRHKGTMYEDVTVEVQPDPAHYLSQKLGLRLPRRGGRLPCQLDRAEVFGLAHLP